MRHKERKGVREFKAIDRSKDEIKGSEGLTLGKDGEVIRNDSWLHPEVMKENKKT